MIIMFHRGACLPAVRDIDDMGIGFQRLGIHGLHGLTRIKYESQRMLKVIRANPCSSVDKILSASSCIPFLPLCVHLCVSVLIRG
jgi:hypothetical protein